jgi:hypothetical protein
MQASFSLDVVPGALVHVQYVRVLLQLLYVVRRTVYHIYSMYVRYQVHIIYISSRTPLIKLRVRLSTEAWT